MLDIGCFAVAVDSEGDGRGGRRRRHAVLELLRRLAAGHDGLGDILGEGPQGIRGNGRSEGHGGRLRSSNVGHCD